MTDESSEAAKNIMVSLLHKLSNFSPKISALKITSCTPENLSDNDHVQFSCNGVSPKTQEKYTFGVDYGKNHVNVDIKKQGEELLF